MSGLRNESATSQTEHCIGTVVLVLMVLLSHGPAIPGDFVWDDHQMIPENPLVRSPDGLHRIWFTTEATDYWPVSYSTHWLEWRVFGARAAGYRIVNILLHAANCLLLWGVLRRLEVPGAFLAAALFAVHPTTVEAVAWILQRKTLLSTLFVLAAEAAYLRFDDSARFRWYVGSLVLFALALLSKTSAVMFPPALLLTLFWRRRRLTSRDLIWTTPLFVLSLAAGLVGMWFQRYRALADETVRDDSFASRLAGAADAVWFYFCKAIFPFRLSFVYPRRLIDPPTAWAYLPLAALLAVLLIAFLFRRTWSAPLWVGFGGYVLWLVPVMGFVNIYFMRYSLVADHWQYTALMNLLALAAGLGVTAAGTSVRGRALARGLAACVAAGLAVASMGRSELYRRPDAIWRDALAQDPQCWLACNVLGTMAARDPFRKEEATTWFHRALRIEPENAENWYNLANCHRDRGDRREAIRCYREALRLRPLMALAHNNLAMVLRSNQELGAAEFHLREAVRLAPGRPEAWGNLGTLRLRVGDAAEAVQLFEKAVALNPHSSELLHLSGVALDRIGRTKDATAQLKAALAVNPSLAASAAELAWILACDSDSSVRNGAAALLWAQKACEQTQHLDPRSLEALAAALAELGRYDEAASVNEQAIQRYQSSRRIDAKALDAMRLRSRLYQRQTPFRR